MRRYLVLMSWVLGWWAIALASRIAWNGDVYGLNYELLQPDGICYTAFTYSYAGLSANFPSDITSAYVPGTFSSVPVEDYAFSGACSGLQARILYPLLSVPFVTIMGVEGMLVLPAISWLIAVMVPSLILLRMGYLLGAIISSALAFGSTSIARWSVTNITDSLLMALSAVLLLLVYRFRNHLSIPGIFLIGSIGAIGAFIRQSWPIWIGIGLVLVLKGLKQKSPDLVRQRRNWSLAGLLLIVVSVLGHVTATTAFGAQNSSWVISQGMATVQSFIPDSTSSTVATKEPAASPSNAAPSQIRPSGDENSSTQQAEQSIPNPDLVPLSRLMYLGLSVLIVEVGALAVLDRPLLLLLLAGVIGAALLPRTLFGAITIVLAITVFGIGMVNGTLGVNFRFQMPLLPWLVLISGMWVRYSQALGPVVRRFTETHAAEPDLGKSEQAQT